MTAILPDIIPTTLRPDGAGHSLFRLAEHPALALLGETMRFAPRKTILAAGAPADAIYELHSGSVRLAMHTPDGRRQIVGFPGPGALIGGIAGGGLEPCSAETLTAVEATRFDRASLETLASVDTALSLPIARALAGELAALQAHVFRLGRLSAEERIAAFLIACGPEADGHSADRGPVLHLAMGREDIADYLGLSVETVSRVMHGLRRGGILAFGRLAVIRISDPDRLAALADGEATAASGGRGARFSRRRSAPRRNIRNTPQSADADARG